MLNDHMTKGSNKSAKGGVNYDPAMLSDVAYAGSMQWARQWLLLRRTEDYQIDGEHDINITVGGSAGHSGCYDIHISEGVRGKGRPARWWTVTDGGTRVERRAKKEQEALQEERQRVANAVVTAQLKGAAIDPLKASVRLGHEKVRAHLAALEVEGKVFEHRKRWYSECYRERIVQDA